MCQYFQNISHGLNLSLCVIQMQSTDCNIRLQSDCWDCSLIAEIAVWLLRLQSDCRDCKSSSTYIYMPQPSTRCQAAISTIELQSTQSGQLQLQLQLSTAIKLQSQQSDCNLSNQTAISAIRLQSSCIAVWLCRLQFDCGDCSLIVKIAVELWRL